jgi:hypothetical protein
VRVLPIVTLAVAMLGAGAVRAPDAGAVCAEAVRWGGTTYLGLGPTKRPLALGGYLAGGVLPGCRDHFPSPPVHDTPVRLRSIAGVGPRVALVRADRPDRIFLAPGLLPALPDFPLHDAIYGSRSRPVDRPWERPPGKRFFACDSVVRRTVTARVRSVWLGLRLFVGGREQTVSVDVRTRVPHANGTVPRFGGGMRVRVGLTECRRGSRFRYRVADRIDVLQ